MEEKWYEKQDHGFNEKEIKLVKYLIADCQSTGDIQNKFKRLFARTIKQKIMAIYAKGMSQRNIEDTLREIYSFEI